MSRTYRGRGRGRRGGRGWLPRDQWLAAKYKRQTEALERAQTSSSPYNEALVVAAFVERGLEASEIKPRENVLTFDAWKALGRHVRKGEKSVKVRCFYTTEAKTDEATGEEIPGGRFMSLAYLFHISQTDPDDDQADQAAGLPDITQAAQEAYRREAGEA